MAVSVGKPSDLVGMAKRVNVNDFLKLVEGITYLLAKENGQIGNMQITGRLVSVQPTGDAIIVGDIHGDMLSLTTILKNSSFMEKASKNEEIRMIFLGDYGDRGLHSPEVYYTILKLKELFPRRITLMRGNHEGPNDLLAYPHDLLDHLQRKFGDASPYTYSALRKLFDNLYNAVLIDERYVLLHGGVPSQASTTKDLAFAHEKHPHETHLEEILWSDPREGIKGTHPSPRGAGRLFGEDITEKLLRVSNTKVLIRGHEPSRDGFNTNHSEKILTLFSRKGPPYHNKFGAYLHLDMSKEVESAAQLIQHIHKF